MAELAQAEIFVGIYRNSYGWIEPSLGISGVHDEHNMRKKLRLPSLVYAYHDGSDREQKLGQIIDDALALGTVFFYSDATELEARVRDDITALTASAFVTHSDGDAPGSRQPTTAIGANHTRQQLQTPGVDEVLSLLAIAERPLSIADLALATRTNAGSVLEALKSVPGNLVFAAGQEITLAVPESELRATRGILATHVEESFYASALSKVMESRGAFIAALALSDRAGALQSEDLVYAAAKEAAMNRDVFTAIPLLQRSADDARRAVAPDLEISLLLTLAILSADAGEHGQAALALERARKHKLSEWGLAIREVELGLAGGSLASPDVLNEYAAVQQEFEDAGDESGAARVALGRSRLFIEAQRFAEAEKCARRAYDVFRASGNQYGITTSAQNLAAALSGLGRHKEARDTLDSIEVAPGADQRRLRAARYNMEARRQRQAGNPARALELSEEAIQLGADLGDVRVQILNRINRANALRDLSRADEALSEYSRAGKDANAASMRLLEGSASRLEAGILNDIGKPERALHIARYAVGLLRESSGRVDFGEAKVEEATSLNAIGEHTAALDAYFEAATVAFETAEPEFLVRVIGDAFNCAEGNGLGDTVPGRILELCEISATGDFRTDLLSVVGNRGAAFRQALGPYCGAVCRRLFSLAIAQFPANTRRLVVRSLVGATLSDSPLGSSGSTYLAVAGALATSVRPEELLLEDWVWFAEQQAKCISGLFFKPHTDGAAHWTISLPESSGLLFTISQLDDAPISSAVAAILAFGLRRIGEGIAKLTVGRDSHRVEVAMVVTTRNEFAQHVGQNAPPLPHDIVSVTRATDESANEPPPIVIILGDQFTTTREDGEEHVAMLMFRVLYEATRHLMRGAVAHDALARHVYPLVRAAVQ
jgi:tetratricopeptide (TPR) repeat protein